MPEFVIFLHPVPGSPGFDAELVDRHCSHLATLAREGRLIAAGPFPDDPDGGMVVGIFDSKDAASAFAAADPFVQAGVETAEVRPWLMARSGNGFLGRLPPEPGTHPFFLETLRLRATTRCFAPKPVAADLVRALLEAAFSAPSEFNLQPWRPIVCDTQSDLLRLQRCCFGQPQVASAGLAVICAVDPAVFHEDAPRAVDELVEHARWAPEERENQIAFVRSHYKDARAHSILNGAIFGHQLLLAGLSAGLLGFWLGGFDDEILRGEFGIPERVHIAGVVGLGWPGGPQTPLPRRPLEQVVGFGAWPGR
ncbi:MAG: nitroreductase family protein [Candidatus Wallbacteria bacterium]|nr:nitroreductase family protein [Candidatus Wallbacteria bacterium]